MGAAVVEIRFLELSEVERQKILVKSLKDSTNGFLQTIDLAKDVGIDPETQGWEETKLGKAFDTTPTKLNSSTYCSNNRRNRLLR